MTSSNNSILLVDDEPESLRLLTGILAEEGYRVRPADSGELALASVAAELPELILLDIHMWGMDGFEVCRRIKAGLLNSGGTTAASAISPYGVAAITALTGLFAKQATDKLREVFETLFRTQQKVERKDALSVASTPAQVGTPSETSKAQTAAAGTAR